MSRGVAADPGPKLHAVALAHRGPDDFADPAPETLLAAPELLAVSPGPPRVSRRRRFAIRPPAVGVVRASPTATTASATTGSVTLELSPLAKQDYGATEETAVTNALRSVISERFKIMWPDGTDGVSRRRRLLQSSVATMATDVMVRDRRLRATWSAEKATRPRSKSPADAGGVRCAERRLRTK